MSVYAWNERILAALWVVWGLWLLVPDLQQAERSPRDVLALLAMTAGSLLLVVQVPIMRKHMDVYRWGDWPASVRSRQALHLFLTAFALLVALAVAIADITQVRIVMYLGLALIHFGKVVRLLRYRL